MTNANEVVVRYLAAWNEPEPKRRRELVAKAWTDDGTYVDAARDGKGHDGLDAMIATAQGHFPGYRLRLASGIEAHHDYLRFSWVAGGTAEAPLYIKGTVRDRRRRRPHQIGGRLRRCRPGARMTGGRDGQENCDYLVGCCCRRRPRHG